MASLIDTLKRSLASLTGGRKGSRSVVGVDVGSSSIKIVQLSSTRGTAVLETYGEIALGPYAKQPVGKVVKLAPEQTAEAVLDLMKEANVTATSAGVAIPFASSLISILDLPLVKADQLKRMIPIEARKYIPVPVSEVTLDWFVIPKDEQSDAFDRLQEETPLQKQGQEVLLVAIHNETLRSYQRIVEQVGLAAGFYEIEIFSAIRSALGTGIAPVVVADIGAAATKIYVVERGIVRMSHLSNVGSQAMTETLARTMSWSFDKAERMKREQGLTDSTAYGREENEQMHQALLSTLSRVFSDVNRVVLSYGKRYNKDVAHVVLTGGGASLPGLAPYANQSLNAEVVIADPFNKVEAPAFLADVLREIGPGFTVAVGSALRKLRQDA